MSMLLESGASNIVNKLDQNDNDPLHYACELNCGDSVQLLLNSDSKVVLTGTFEMFHLVPTTFQKIFHALVDRRNGMRHLALHLLPEDVVRQLRVPRDRVLDA